MKNIKMLSHVNTVLLCFSLSISSSFANSSKLDALFEGLKNASNEIEARAFEQKIWLSWTTADDPQINRLMQEALRKREGYDFAGAVEILNQIISIDPEYAEAWNQRATVYFHQSEHEKSLEDIARVLELEPRHFGALAGRAVIRLQQGKPALGMQNVLEAMKYHPFLKERAFFPSLTLEAR